MVKTPPPLNPQDDQEKRHADAEVASVAGMLKEALVQGTCFFWDTFFCSKFKALLVSQLVN